MTPDGLVGHIILAGSNSSRVLRLDDLNSRIPVMSERSEAVAVLAGDNSDFPKLLFIDVGMDWQVGDLIMTSGDDGRLPRGLVVGHVVETSNGELRAKLAGLQTPVDWVWVALFAPIETPVAVDMPLIEIEEGDIPPVETSQTVDGTGPATAETPPAEGVNP